ncbi:hypothetical protein Q9R29_01205 [Rothia sp. ARF10]|nr:hypothetical protein [Rothia sp. ARF10]
MDEPSIDTTFDVRSDAGGKDPDSHSPTLRRYHQFLWGKPLPDGSGFDLDAKLHHQSDRGEFWFASDAITNTYRGWLRPAHIVRVLDEVPADEVAAFYDLGCTVGAYTIFPYPVHREGKWQRSINQKRGTLRTIRDRCDLTLECIRRHYLGVDSPLAPTLNWHASFFQLFGSFEGYVDHFLLNDLVNDDGTIKWLSHFDDFASDALPASSAEYRLYMGRSMEFINQRNERIASFARSAEAGLPAS